MPRYDNSDEVQAADNESVSGGGGGNRLQRILSAVASVAGPGIAGAANQRGRASFAGGMTGGATAELNQQAAQQDIKFGELR